MRAFPLLLTLATALVLAGCASDDPSPDATPTPNTGAGATPTSPTAGAGSTDGSTTDATDSIPWAAYRLDETVTPRSGGAGKIQSFAYTSTQTQGAEVTILDVTVESLGTSTENVRSQKVDLTTGTQTPVSVPVEVTKLKHTITVREDGSGELQAGDTATATLWLPTSETTAPSMFLWRFVHVDFEDGDESGVWEYVADPNAQQAFPAPYTEGDDPNSWWGFEHLLATYGLSWWAGLFAEGSNLEEGSYNFGGFAYRSERETLRVGGYTFDGWRVTWSGASEGDSADFTVAVAPSLPLPVEQDFGSNDGGSGGSRTKFELTALDLG